MIRKSIILVGFIGALVLFLVTQSDHRMATNWPIQIGKDVAVAIIGMMLLYGAHRLFNHIRMHRLLPGSEKPYTNQHVALAIAMLLSCAYIIGSALQSAV